MLSNLQVCFNAVMPLFLIMGLGYGVKCLGGIRVEDVPGLNKMAFRFFMPVMLFWNLYTSSIDQALQPKLLLFAVGATLVMYGLSLAIVLPTEKDHEKQGVKIQGMYRSNLAIIGLPLATVLVPGADMGPVAMLAAIIVLAIMILPSIINVAMTALEAVPREYEDASLALGATATETWFKVSVPAARSGIAAAVVLGVGRAIGEAMAVMMVSGNVPNMPSLFQSVRFLTTAVASEMGYAAAGLQRQALFSIALVLFLFIMLINAALNFFLKRSKEK
mgnify:CR=1 FL=1